MANNEMKHALILHGAGNDNTGNWFPWLKSELEKKEYTVWLPTLPHNDNPHRQEWVDFIFANKEFVFNQDTLLIGHSAGATLILRLLEQLAEDIKIDNALLVSAYVELGEKEFTYPYKKDMLDIPFNWEKIKQSANAFVFIHSNNDPYQCGEDQGRVLHQNLGGKLIIEKGQGHFNLEQSTDYTKFPLILQIVN